MGESPAFKKNKDSGNLSVNPLKESFGNRYNLKFVLLALFGAVMGQGVVWYTGQFYAMSFMKTVMAVDSDQVDKLLGIGLLFGTPFFLFFGWLSDKVGRKWVMLSGMLVALLLYRPIYKTMYQTTNLDNKTELVDKRVVLKESVVHTNNTKDSLYTTLKYFTDGTHSKQVRRVVLEENNSPKIVDNKVQEFIKTTKFLESSDRWILTLLIFVQVFFITMVYGPIAAFLVEMFPVKIRYTSMSLPYHIGNGIFGGLLPAVSTYLTINAQADGDPEFYLAGLWYPIAISAVCFIIGAIYINKKTTSNIDE